jgi:hypothetical protein
MRLIGSVEMSAPEGEKAGVFHLGRREKGRS